MSMLINSEFRFSGTYTYPETQTGFDPALISKFLPPYKVIIYNDEHNTMDYVIKTLMQIVPQLSLEQANEITMEAHTVGWAVVTRCPKETAEYYCDSLKKRGLQSTIEKE